MSIEQANIFCYVISGMNMKDFSEQMISDLTKEKQPITNNTENEND